MNVCIVTYSLYESDSRVMRYAEALAARGNSVDVFALRKEGKPEFEVMAGVHVFRVHTRGFREKRRASFLKGVCSFFVKAWWQLTRRHLRRHYDFLHINSIPDFLVFVALVPKLMGAKVVLDVHDILPELYASKFGVSRESFGFKLMLLLERWSAAFADHVITANHLWQQRLLSRSVSAGRCTTLMNYPDRTIFRPAPPDRPKNGFVMMYPGTLNHHQGLDVAIRAFALIADQVPNATFRIHGEGRMQNELVRLVEEMGLQQRVLFRPMLPIREIARVIADVDLAVVPKRRDSFGDEAFSTKILEFMSVGVPVLVSDTTIDKYYFNDTTVKFFRAGDEKDLAQSMLLMINDADLRRRLVRNASEFVRAFDWEVNKQRYLDLVDSLVSGNDQERPNVAARATGAAN